MHKYIGAFLVAAGSAAIGMVTVISQKRHIQLLDELCASLRLMSAELGTRLRPLPELICELSEKGDSVSGFYGDIAGRLDFIGETDFSVLWSDAVENIQLLSADERETMNRLGAVLGRYELREQLDSIDICLDALTRSVLGLRAEYPCRRRLFLGLSAAAGLMILIILI